MKFPGFVYSLLHEPVFPETVLSREKWTIEILQILVIITALPAVALLGFFLAGIFSFSESYLIFIDLGLLILGWMGARRGGWRWAGWIPPIMSYTLAAYSLNENAVNHTTILLMAMSVMLAGLLQGKKASLFFVILCTVTYGLLMGPEGTAHPYRFGASILIVFFSLTGLMLLQWYFFSQLGENLKDWLDSLRQLEEEKHLRLAAEQDKEIQESQLKRLTDHMTDLVAEIDQNGNYLYVSPSYLNVLGFSPQDLLNTSAFSQIHPSDVDRVRNSFETILKEIGSEVVQYRVRHREGHYIWVETSGTVIARNLESDQTVAISSREITRQKMAEEMTRASEEKFRSIIESVPLGIHMYVLEDENRLVFNGYNPSANKILGVDHSIFLGKSIEEAFPGLVGTEIPEAYREVARTGNPWSGTQIVYDDGKIHGAYEVNAFQTTAGRMATFFSEITEKVKAEEALRLSEEKFSTAFITSPDSININRLTDGMYVDMNQGFTRITGYTREDVIGKTSLELNIWVDPVDRQRLVEGLRRDGVVENLEAQFRKKDGSIIQGLMSARIIDVNGEKCILNISRDITERKQAEIEVHKAHADLEKAYEATLQGWARALDMREHETADHSRRVIDYTVRIASRLGVPEEDLIHVRRGALLHDVGKVGIPDSILLKPGPLTDDEWVIMRQHPVNAYNLIKDIDYLQLSLDIPYCHHERWDGGGYPRGLAGTDIPLVARIFSIVDVWDALLSNRPYRPAWQKTDVLKYIQDKAGTQFDPDIVSCCLEILS